MAKDIYQLGDVAAILGIEKSRVKNWTIGRPFSLRPSLRSSYGKGSRNLFSRNDVNRFALVERLRDVGAPVVAIQELIEKLSPELAKDSVWKMTEGKHHWAVISREEPTLIPYNVYLAVSFPDILPRQEHAFSSLCSTLCFYAVNLSEIANSVATRVSSLSHGTKNDKRHVRAKRVRTRK